eukprot:s3061_g6.t1
MRKKALGKSMKRVRQVVLNTLSEGTEGLQVPVSKPMVKLMTLLAMQPMVAGVEMNQVELKALEIKYEYFDFFVEHKFFMIFYALFFIFIGIGIGFFINKALYNEKVVQVARWTMREFQRLRRRREIALVDDWDPMNQEFKQFRVLADARDADSGEEFFRETETGLAKYVRPHRQARERLKVEELDPLDASMLLDPDFFPEYAQEDAEEEGGTIDHEVVDAQIQTDVSSFPDHRGPEPGIPHETMELPGSPAEPPDQLPDLPMLGLDWNDFDVAENHFPLRQRERALNSKSGPNLCIFIAFYFQMCFSPQRRVLFRHFNFQKCCEHAVFSVSECSGHAPAIAQTRAGNECLWSPLRPCKRLGMATDRCRAGCRLNELRTAVSVLQAKMRNQEELLMDLEERVATRDSGAHERLRVVEASMAALRSRMMVDMMHPEETLEAKNFPRAKATKGRHEHSPRSLKEAQDPFEEKQLSQLSEKQLAKDVQSEKLLDAQLEKRLVALEATEDALKCLRSDLNRVVSIAKANGSRLQALEAKEEPNSRIFSCVEGAAQVATRAFASLDSSVKSMELQVSSITASLTACGEEQQRQAMELKQLGHQVARLETSGASQATDVGSQLLKGVVTCQREMQKSV